MERADLEHWRAKEVARLFALVDTERRYYQDIVANLPVGMLILNADLTVRSANRSFRQIFGYRADEVIRRRLEQVIPAPDLRHHVEAVLGSGHPRGNLAVETNGERGARSLRVSVLPLRNWDDEAEEVLLIVEDSTPLERRVPAASFPAITDVFDRIGGMVWEYDPGSHRFVYVNACAEQVLGFPTTQWLNSGDFWTERIHPSDREWMTRQLDELAAQGSERTFEYRAATLGGGTRWLREAVRVQRGADGSPRRLFGVALDMTARQTIEEQRLTSHRMDALTRLAGRLSHDFNNALMVLSGYGEEVAGAVPPGHPLREDVGEMLRATQRLVSMTRELYLFARRPAPELEALDWNAFVERLIPAFRGVAGEKAELLPLLSSSAGSVRANAAELERVLRGLFAWIVGNRAPAGSVIAVETGVEIRSESCAALLGGGRPGWFAFAAFTDAGPEMDALSRSRVFEPMENAPAPDDAMGPAGIYSALRTMEGDIRISSDAGSTRFCVLLPRLEPEGEEAPADLQTSEALAPAAGKTVLVVEDEAGIRTLVRKILSRHGYRVLEAANGADALALIRDSPESIDLVLTDLRMPQKGGRELSEAAREKYPDAGVLFISGFHEDPGLSGVNLPPRTAFLQKPFTLGSLLLKVREMLGREGA